MSDPGGVQVRRRAKGRLTSVRRMGFLVLWGCGDVAVGGC